MENDGGLQASMDRKQYPEKQSLHPCSDTLSDLRFCENLYHHGNDVSVLL